MVIVNIFLSIRQYSGNQSLIDRLGSKHRMLQLVDLNGYGTMLMFLSQSMHQYKHAHKLNENILMYHFTCHRNIISKISRHSTMVITPTKDLHHCVCRDLFSSRLCILALNIVNIPCKKTSISSSSVLQLVYHIVVVSTFYSSHCCYCSISHVPMFISLSPPEFCIFTP